MKDWDVGHDLKKIIKINKVGCKHRHHIKANEIWGNKLLSVRLCNILWRAMRVLLVDWKESLLWLFLKMWFFCIFNVLLFGCCEADCGVWWYCITQGISNRCMLGDRSSHSLTELFSSDINIPYLPTVVGGCTFKLSSSSWVPPSWCLSFELLLLLLLLSSGV